MTYGINLAFRSSGCGGGPLPGNVEQPPQDNTIPEVDEPTPIEDTPDWEIPPDPTPPPTVPPPPPLIVHSGREVAQSRLEANGVAYRNPHAGPKDKKVKGKLVEVATTQGLIAAAVKDQDNYIGTTYDVGSGKLKAKQKIANVESDVGEVIAAVDSGDEIGAMVKGNSFYITHNNQAVAGPFAMPADLLEKPAGLVAKGPATPIWINGFAVDAIRKGYGNGYGFSYGQGA